MPPSTLGPRGDVHQAVCRGAGSGVGECVEAPPEAIQLDDVPDPNSFEPHQAEGHARPPTVSVGWRGSN